MSGLHGIGPAWRHLRTDRSVGRQRVGRDTVRRVIGFAKPQKGIIAGFLALTVVDAALVVVTPLLIKTIVDDGILVGDRALVTWLALAVAGVAVVDAGWRWPPAGCPRASVRG